MESCAICNLHSNESERAKYEITRNKLWVLRHHPNPAPLQGWLLLDSHRHLKGPIDFEPEEAASWGRAVQSSSRLVQQLTKCDRVYAIAFGEGAHHLHLHLIPRLQLDPATTAWAVADHYREISSSKCAATNINQVAKFVEQARLIIKSFELGV